MCDEDSLRQLQTPRAQEARGGYIGLPRNFNHFLAAPQERLGIRINCVPLVTGLKLALLVGLVVRLVRLGPLGRLAWSRL